MRLSELITYVEQIAQTSDSEATSRRGEPLFENNTVLEDQNAVRIERQPVPIWIRDGGRIERIDGREGVVLRIDQEIPPSDLPSDVRAPNTPIDTLAYYLPFHLHGDDWGIYLRESGMLFAASVLKGTALSAGDSALVDGGRKLLLDHESMHFQAEVACARAEVIVNRRLYELYFQNGFAAAHEEAIANAFAFHRLRREPKPVQNRVATWMKTQGPGYRDFDRWLDPKKFAPGCRRASQYMLKTLARGWSHRPEPAEFLFDSMRYKPPMFIVRDVSLATVLKPLPKANGIRVLVHTREHPPPHIHIEIPVGQPVTRYEWPKLQPLEGDLKLSKSDRKKLDVYLEKYRPKIDAEVRSVFTGVTPLFGTS